MNGKFFLFLLSAVLCCFAAKGDESENISREGRGFNRGGFNRGIERGGFNRGNRGNRGSGMRSAVFAEVEIAKKFPEKYAEVDALREKYEAELAELAKKSGVELPRSMESKMRQIRKADPAAFDAAVEKMKTSPREGMQLLNAAAAKAGVTLFPSFGGRDRGGIRAEQQPPAPQRMSKTPSLSKLRKKYPEQMKKYDALRSKDPAGAKKMLLEIIEMDKSAAK
ncbi:MAG: hypothetical protein E7058_00045 [Lentisphaerae bacterium]|nr:hypothetical protein [Lentisphaerota bacterium]